MRFISPLFLRLAPMLVVMGMIFYLSHQPGDTLYLPAIPGIDKVCHLAVYALLALTVLWYFSSDRQQPPGMVVLQTILFCLIFGLSDEFHQSYIPYRSVSSFDLLADLAGASLVCGIWLHSKGFREVVHSGYMVLIRKTGRNVDRSRE